MRRLTSAEIAPMLAARTALAEPLVITQDGVDRYVLLPIEAYVRLSEARPDPVDLDIPDADLDAIEWNR